MGIENEGAYREVLNKILETKIIAFGLKLTLAKVRRIGGLQVDDEGRVLLISADPQRVIHDLLLTFESIAGLAATVATKAALLPLKQKYPNLKLPQKLM